MQIMKPGWGDSKAGKRKIEVSTLCNYFIWLYCGIFIFFSIKVIRKKIIAYFLYIDAYLRHYCKLSWACNRRISLQNACFVKKKLNSINALGGSCAGISKEWNVIYLKLLPPWKYMHICMFIYSTRYAYGWGMYFYVCHLSFLLIHHILRGLALF